MKKIILLINFFMIVSCSNINNLGNNYWYLSNQDAIDIGYPYGSIIYNSINEDQFNNILIFSDIISLNNNDDYIIVKQNPNRSIKKERISDDIKFWNEYYLQTKKDSIIEIDKNKISLVKINEIYLKKNSIEKVTDSLFNLNSINAKIFKNKINYYIIHKINDSIFGPLTISEFETLKKKNSIDLEFE